MRLSSLVLRQWKSRPGRALATVASVAVAVGAVVATWVSADASRVGYRKLAESIEGRPTVDIISREGGRYRGTLVPPLLDVEGVRAVVPVIYRPTLLRVGPRRVNQVIIGLSVAELVDAGLLTLTAGVPCRGTDELLISERLADALDVGVDDRLLYYSRSGPSRVWVSGIVSDDSLQPFSEGGGVVMEIDPVQSVFGDPGLVDRTRLLVQDDTDRGSLVVAVQERLPDSLTAMVPAGRASMASDMLAAANLGLDFVTALTVAMAWFIVGNTMLMNVTERRRSFALERVLGATRRQVSGMLLAEAAVIGLAGAFAGVVGGLLAAGPVSNGIAQAIRAPDAPIAYSPLVILMAALVGPLVAVAAAWWPSRKAARVDLLEGIAHAASPPAEGFSWRLIGLAAALWAVAMAVLFLVALGILPPRASVPAGIATTVSFIAATPVVLPPIARGLARLVPSRFRVEGSLALEQILRQPLRTALTTGVLVVAVSNGVALGHAIRDNVDDVLGWYAKGLKADWVLTRGGAFGVGRESPAATGPVDVEVAALEGVRRVEPIAITMGQAARQGDAGGPSVGCVVVGRDMPAEGPLPLKPVGVDEQTLREILTGDAVAAGTVLAKRTGSKVGDEINLTVYGRTVGVRLAALVVDYTGGGSSIYMNRDLARRLLGMESVDALLVTAEPGRSDALAGPLGEIADRHEMIVQSYTQVVKVLDRIVGGVVSALWTILGLGFVVGSLGVANTVTMSVLEKRRTLGLLRTVGMTSGQVMRLVLIESVLLGMTGCVIGVLGGVATSAFIQIASQPLTGHPVGVSFRPAIVAMSILAAVLVTVLAAWLPARRAVRLDLLDSISAE
jgi:putative ABC transport system permease protein